MGKASLFGLLASLALLSLTRVYGSAPSPEHHLLAAIDSGESARANVPDRATQAKAEQTVRSVFRAEYANRTLAGRQDLARRLLDQAGKTLNDPAVRYVSLREAKDLAAGAGDAATALAAIDDMNKSFAVDAPDLKTAALITAGQQVITPEGNAALTQMGLTVLADAVEADNLQAASRLGTALETMAARSKQLPLVTTVSARNREIADLRHDYEARRTAQDTLKTKPDDPDANLIVGRYVAFWRGDWDAGLPMLAKSSDAATKSLADREVAKPTDPMTQAQLADGWWELGQKQGETQRSRLHQHALMWYQRAWAKLTDTQRSKCAGGHLPTDALAQLNANSVGGSAVGSGGAGSSGTSAAAGAVRPGMSVPPPAAGKATLVRVFPPQLNPIISVQLTPDLHRIIALAKPGGPAVAPVLWDADSGTEIAAWHGYFAQLLPDGKRAIVQYDKKWRLIDVGTGKELSVITALEAANGLISEDGTRLLIYKIGKDGFAALCDLTTTAEPKRFDAAAVNLATPALARDGRSFVTVPMWADFTMRDYASETGREVWRVEVPGGCDRLSYSQDGTRLIRVTHAAADVSIHDARTGELLALCRGNKRCVQAALASSNRFVVTTCDDPGIGMHLFDLASVDPKKVCKPLDWPSMESAGPATVLALSADDRRVLAAFKDKSVRLIDVQSGRQLAKLEGITGDTLCVGFSADGRFAVTGGEDKTVRLWRLPDPPRSGR